MVLWFLLPNEGLNLTNSTNLFFLKIHLPDEHPQSLNPKFATDRSDVILVSLQLSANILTLLSRCLQTHLCTCPFSHFGHVISVRILFLSSACSFLLSLGCSLETLVLNFLWCYHVFLPVPRALAKCTNTNSPSAFRA